MREYAFVTKWRFDAPIEKVWDVIYDSLRWSDWWKYVKRVEEIQAGDEQGIGAIRRQTWTTRLPYSFTFDTRIVRVEKPHLLEAVASGDLNGTGRWTLSEDGRFTSVRYDWNVRTAKNWMNLIAPIAKPFFAWNHDAVMRAGGLGLARALGAKLIEE
jgi:uncharacterized protein YndB with AHSA1/START domain